MNKLAKHIILLGFKHVGKSTVGMALAEKLHLPFFDLDQHIEKNYQREYHQLLSCREIFKQHGDAFFRAAETMALRQVIDHPPAVIAVGGGTPMRAENQHVLKPHWLVHITTPPAVAYARIIAHGQPAFFPADQQPLDFFQHLWQQREPVYTHLANITVDNTQNITHTLTCILETLEKAR